MEEVTREFVKTEPRGSILVLEDNPADQRRIQEGLGELPVENLEFAANAGDFHRLLGQRDFDVASIDWDIRGRWVGKRILGEVRAKDRLMSAIVYSVNAKKLFVATRARNLGAYEVVKKTSDLKRDNYVPVIRQGVRIAMARRILETMRLLGLKELPNLEEGGELAEELEAEICERSRAEAIQRVFWGQDDAGLKGLLYRRGWWRIFDPVAYSKLSRRDQLIYLCKCSDLRKEKVATILRCEEEEVHDALESSLWDASERSSLPGAFSALTSILFYYLRWVGYEPDLLQVAVRVKSVYGPIQRRPPWDEEGLEDFLLEGGQSSLHEAIEWIRKV